MSFNEHLTDNVIRKLEELCEKYEIIRKAKILIKHKNTDASDYALCKIELHLPESRILAETLAENFDIAVEKTIRKLKIKLPNTGLSKSTSKNQSKFRESAI